MRRLLLLSLVLAGCQRKHAVPTCDAMADHVLALFQPADAFAHDVRDVLAKRCTADGWSEAMRSCIGSTASVTEPQNCKQKLLPELAKLLETDLKAAEENEQHRAIPDACLRYEQVLKLAVKCDKLPQEVRDGLVNRLADSKREWAQMGDKRELAGVCASAIKAVKSASLECPGVGQW